MTALGISAFDEAIPMDRASKIRPEGRTAEIVDFDEAMLDSFAPDLRASLLAEARLIARAFVSGGQDHDIQAMACALSSGAWDREMNRKHARRLAAALRRLARERAA